MAQDSDVTFKKTNELIDTVDKGFTFFEKRKWLVRFVVLTLFGGGSWFGYEQHKELASYKSAVTVNVNTDDDAKTMVIDNYAKETRRQLNALRQKVDALKANYEDATTHMRNH